MRTQSTHCLVFDRKSAGTSASYQLLMITGGFPSSKGRTVMKPLFRLDPACSGALSGRILFGGRFSHGVAMGCKRSAPCGASDRSSSRKLRNVESESRETHFGNPPHAPPAHQTRRVDFPQPLPGGCAPVCFILKAGTVIGSRRHFGGLCMNLKTRCKRTRSCPVHSKEGDIMERPLWGFGICNGPYPWRCHGLREVGPSGAHKLRLPLRGGMSPPAHCLPPDSAPGTQNKFGKWPSFPECTQDEPSS
jgi:hypothetical protein